MKILFIAYSCSPDKGSEDRIAWNICLESAIHNKIYVFTKEESRYSIESFRRNNPDKLKNIQFFYVDIPSIYKKILNRFLYSARLNVWHRKAFPLVRQIVNSEGIHIIHQLTPNEFRSIGKYGFIPKTMFVCGPVGGAEYVPKCLHKYIKGSFIIENVRRAVNYYYKSKYHWNGTFRKCDYLFSINNETLDYINVDGEILIDIGVNNKQQTTNKKKKEIGDTIIFLVVGRLIYRKGHRFLFDVLKTIDPDKPYKVIVVGDGKDKKKLMDVCEKEQILKKHVEFNGMVPYLKMKEIYNRADVLIFPSIREASGNVLVEAMESGLPVITINKFGGALIINDRIGWKYSGNTEREILYSLRDAILECIDSPEVINQKRKRLNRKLKKYTWQKKVNRFEEIYNGLLQHQTQELSDIRGITNENHIS